MIPRECKRLAEVDFPIAGVSRHAARENSARRGLPSTLHMWWARRPLASCRSTLLGLLLPDPCDVNCPQSFKDRAREILRPIPGKVGDSDTDLQAALVRFIADIADWEAGTNSTFLGAARHLVNAAFPEEQPLVVDPFAGGGSIPLEALRLGCDVFASDLNPIPVLLNKVVIEYAPRFGPLLSAGVKKWSEWLLEEADRALAPFYPVDEVGAVPIAYLWSRTIRCEAPGCGALIPLMNQRLISKRRGVGVRLSVNGANVTVDIVTGKATEFETGTVRNAKVTCPVCHSTMSADRYRARAHAGELGELHYCTVLRNPDGTRTYRNPTEGERVAFNAARDRLQEVLASDSTVLPREELSSTEPRRLNVIQYGYDNWGMLFNDRQKLFWIRVSGLLTRLWSEMQKDDVEKPVSEAVFTLICLSVSNVLQYNCNMSTWLSDGMISVFIQSSSIPMRADYAEANPLMEKLVGGLRYQFERTQEVLSNRAIPSGKSGTVVRSSASVPLLPSESVDLLATDPPYYFAIPYAELADFFYVWLKRFLRSVHGDLFASSTSPKEEEAIQNLPHSKAVGQKDRAHFERKIFESLQVAREQLKPNGLALIVFAHASTEGWEALLKSLLAAGWIVTASWPIETERSGRMLASRQRTLASSIHLVCRPRGSDASVGDWAEVLRELPGRVSDWMSRLEHEGVHGADQVFACIGPALEIFSRYARVETPDGREVQLAEYLEKVWEVVGRTALEQVLGSAEAQARNGGSGALEEDARLTALFLWTLRSTLPDGENSRPDEEEVPVSADASTEEDDSTAKKSKSGPSLVFDIARRFSQPLGIHLEAWHGRIIDIDKKSVRLLPVSERARQLFGDMGASGAADRIEKAPLGSAQIELFPELNQDDPPASSRGKSGVAGSGAGLTPTRATTLDRLHAAMLLQGSGRTSCELSIGCPSGSGRGR